MSSAPDWLQQVRPALEADPPLWWRSFRPPAQPPRRSAVLVLFSQGSHGTDVVLTERASSLRAHASQVVFPGGHVDPDDAGPVAAALRESEEEVGIAPVSVEIVDELPPLYLTPSSNAVTPVLGWWRTPGPLRVVDPAEVARVGRVGLTELLDPANRFSVRIPGTDWRGPGFEVDGFFVWGFTALLLDHVLTLAGRNEDWNQEIFRPLPKRLLDPYR